MGGCISKAKAKVKAKVPRRRAIPRDELFEPAPSNRKVLRKMTSSAEIAPTVEWDDTDRFIPPVTKGRVIKVFDGDTVTVAAIIPYDPERKIYRFTVRLAGIDTPEIRTDDPDELDIAQRAQEALSDLILHKWVHLKNIETEKYGRILADIYCSGLHVNQWMLDHRWAVPYNGNTKDTPDSWRAYHRRGVLREDC